MKRQMYPGINHRPRRGWTYQREEGKEQSQHVTHRIMPKHLAQLPFTLSDSEDENENENEDENEDFPKRWKRTSTVAADIMLHLHTRESVLVDGSS